MEIQLPIVIRLTCSPTSGQLTCLIKFQELKIKPITEMTWLSRFWKKNTVHIYMGLTNKTVQGNDDKQPPQC